MWLMIVVLLVICAIGFRPALSKEIRINFQPKNSVTIRTDEYAKVHFHIETNGSIYFPLKLMIDVKDDVNLKIITESTFSPRSARGVVLSTVFTIIIAIFVTVNTFLMGTQLDLEVIRDVVKRPFGPVIGFCCQFIMMPLIAFGWGMLILRDIPSFQFGYFAVGCAPGGGASNFWTILLDGNVDLSVTMTFFSNLSALVMMPFWLYTLGIIIKLRFVIFIFTFGIYANFYIFKLMYWQTLVPGFLLPWTGYAVSYAIAWALRQSHRNCRTIAIETGIQNGGIPIVLLSFSMPKPDADITLVMPVSVLMFTSLPLYVALITRVIKKRCGEKKVGAPQDENKQSEESSNENKNDHSGTTIARKIEPAESGRGGLNFFKTGEKTETTVVSYDNKGAELNDFTDLNLQNYT